MLEDLKKIIKGDLESTDEVLEKYSHDASIFKVRPTVVVYPRNTADICALVKWVNDSKGTYPNLSLTMRAAGTCMSGGSLNTSIIVDVTRYMNDIGEVRRVAPYSHTPLFPHAREVTVTGEVNIMPGAFYRDLETKTLALGLVLPCFTASKTINALGGMVGNNSGGELTLRYGKMEDYVSELGVVFSDGYEYTVKPVSRRELYQKIAQTDREGEVYKKVYEILKENDISIRAAKPQVSKNSAGYNLWNILQKGNTEDEDVFDLCQLFIGSQGTLGLVTRMTLRLVDAPVKSKLVTVFLRDLSRLGDIVDAILPLQPLTIESYDDKTFKLAMKFFKDFVKAKGLWGMVRFGLSFIPEFFMVLTGGVPKLIMLVEFDGKTEEEIDTKCRALVKSLKPFSLKVRITRNEAEAKKYWDMRRDSFALLRKHVAGRRTAPFIDDIIVVPEKLPEFLPKLNALFAQYPELVYTIAGHAGNGNFHIIPLMDFTREDTITTILDLSEKVYALVLSYGGSITAEHNDGIIRTPYLPDMFGQNIFELFKQVKNVCDPKNIFNPGKKVGITKAELAEKIGESKEIVAHGS